MKRWASREAGVGVGGDIEGVIVVDIEDIRRIADAAGVFIIFQDAFVLYSFTEEDIIRDLALTAMLPLQSKIPCLRDTRLFEREAPTLRAAA